MAKTRARLASSLPEHTEEEPQTKRVRPNTETSRNSEAPPLRPRVDSPWKIGAHVSAAGGIENAVSNALAIGANAFALFLKSQRKWTSPDLKETTIEAFKERMDKHGYDPKHVLPHGSYLINMGNPDADKRAKSYECFLDDLARCSRLGLTLYNFHPGSTVGEATTAESIAYIAECLNRAHQDPSTGSVVTVIENMAGAGNIIGGEFSHLRDIVQLVEDKTRVGVCLDTCHMFAAGYDIRTKEAWEKTISDFDSIVGIQYLRGIHLNDSMTELGSHKDRHDNIGCGHIGFAAFRHIVSDVRTQGIPIVLETPSLEDPEVWATEIEMLQKAPGMSGENIWEEHAAAIKAVVKGSGKGKGKEKEKKKKVATKVAKVPAKARGRKKKVQEEEEEDCSDDAH
ncbi:AP endonuclease [Cylindrobasidium torrendii FP15055 ss-10]|uniref:Apurinic-apyrimidinic endonuclease 1 n=1 Tax=Cylindrobasidium torrendii FP15055 ss-10 TaxID=1314674 RepID=A0A0D7BF50_9AGAR|nr:AP endonuclease [Cylindrobasidium torrendii FP15055 ss-10]